MLRGLEDTVLENITTYAVSPCNCCRDGPVAFCCRRQKKCLINVQLYEEGFTEIEFYRGCVENGASSCKFGQWSDKSFLAVTDTGFFYDYFDCLRYDYDDDVDFDEIEDEERFRFEWNRSTHIIVKTNEECSYLSVKMIIIIAKESDDPNPAYRWLELKFYLPWARIREISDLMQEKRRAVLESSAYKEMMEYISMKYW